MKTWHRCLGQLSLTSTEHFSVDPAVSVNGESAATTLTNASVSTLDEILYLKHDQSDIDIFFEHDGSQYWKSHFFKFLLQWWMSSKLLLVEIRFLCGNTGENAGTSDSQEIAAQSATSVTQHVTQPGAFSIKCYFRLAMFSITTTLLYSTILYYTVLYCTILYYTVLYCTILY